MAILAIISAALGIADSNYMYWHYYYSKPQPGNTANEFSFRRVPGNSGRLVLVNQTQTLALFCHLLFVVTCSVCLVGIRL